MYRVTAPRGVREAALSRWRAAHAGRADAVVVEWHATLARFGASELNERFVKATGTPMAASASRAWFAVQAVAENALRPRDPDPYTSLGRLRFDGHKGRALTFAPDPRGLQQPLYILA